MEATLKKDHSIGRKFKTMADGRNFIDKTTIYTSKMKVVLGQKYYGRGKGDIGNGGFLDTDGIWNQFVTIGKTDVGYRNEYLPEVKNGIWIERSVFDDKEKQKEWIETRGIDPRLIRVFLKEKDKNEYMCIGIFEYSFSDKKKNAVIWKKYEVI